MTTSSSKAGSIQNPGHGDDVLDIGHAAPPAHLPRMTSSGQTQGLLDPRAQKGGDRLNRGTPATTPRLVGFEKELSSAGPNQTEERHPEDDRGVLEREGISVLMDKQSAVRPGS